MRGGCRESVGEVGGRPCGLVDAAVTRERGGGGLRKPPAPWRDGGARGEKSPRQVPSVVYGRWRGPVGEMGQAGGELGLYGRAVKGEVIGCSRLSRGDASALLTSTSPKPSAEEPMIAWRLIFSLDICVCCA